MDESKWKIFVSLDLLFHCLHSYKVPVFKLYVNMNFDTQYTPVMNKEQRLQMYDIKKMTDLRDKI